MTLSTLLRRGVGLQLEVMPQPEPEHLAETLVAFANGDGGTVLLGVDHAGNILGSLQTDEAEGILRAALSQTRPVVRTDWQQFEDRSGTAIAMHVAAQHGAALAGRRPRARPHPRGQRAARRRQDQPTGGDQGERRFRDGSRRGRLPRRPGRGSHSGLSRAPDGSSGSGPGPDEGRDSPWRGRARSGRDIPRSLAFCFSARIRSSSSRRAASSTCASPAQSRAVPAGWPVTAVARSSTAHWRASSSGRGACCFRRCAARRSCAACSARTGCFTRRLPSARRSSMPSATATIG